LRSIALVYEDMLGTVDGIRDYCVHLAAALSRHDVRAEIRPLKASFDDVDVAILQYNPFSYGRWGVAPMLPLRLRKIRAASGAGLAVVLHESYVPAVNWRWALMGAWQRLQFSAVTSIADVLLTPVEPLATRLNERRGRRMTPAHHLPVGSNVPDMRHVRDKHRAALGVGEATVVLAAFGTAHPSRLLEHLAAAANTVYAAGYETLVLNLGADAPPIADLNPSIPVRRPGPLAPNVLARELAVADVFMAPFVDGVSTRRTTLMAALQHGLPIVGTAGPFTDGILREATDALLLVDPHRPNASAEAAVRLAGARSEREARGRAARALYEQAFDWPVISAELLAKLPMPERDGRP
jgi:glycosyltransferase involved in cell wall biosynthesis